MKVYCIHCGKELTDDAQFCVNCGQKCGVQERVEESSTSVQRISPAGADTFPHGNNIAQCKKRNPFKRGKIICALVSAIIVLLIVAWLFLTPSSATYEVLQPGTSIQTSSRLYEEHKIYVEYLYCQTLNSVARGTELGSGSDYVVNFSFRVTNNSQEAYKLKPRNMRCTNTYDIFGSEDYEREESLKYVGPFDGFTLKPNESKTVSVCYLIPETEAYLWIPLGRSEYCFLYYQYNYDDFMDYLLRGGKEKEPSIDEYRGTPAIDMTDFVNHYENYDSKRIEVSGDVTDTVGTTLEVGFSCEEDGVTTTIFAYLTFDTDGIKKFSIGDKIYIDGDFYISEDHIRYFDNATVSIVEKAESSISEYSDVDYSWIEGEYFQAHLATNKMYLYFDEYDYESAGTSGPLSVCFQFNDEYSILGDGRVYYTGGEENPKLEGELFSSDEPITIEYDGYNFVVNCPTLGFNEASFCAVYN